MKYTKVSDNPWIVEVAKNGKTEELFIEFPWLFRSCWLWLVILLFGKNYQIVVDMY